MNIFQYSRVKYIGNFNRDFFWFCMKKNIKLFKYLLINLFYKILSICFNLELFEINKFRYLKVVPKLDAVVEEFYNSHNKIHEYSNIKKYIVFDRIPKQLIKDKTATRIIGYELDSNFRVNIEKYNSEIGKITECTNLFVRNINDLINIKSENTENICIVNKNRIRLVENIEKLKRIKFYEKKIIFALIVVLLSAFLTCVSFCFTMCPLDIDMYKSYFEIKLFLLNMIPILLLITMIYLISRKISISYLISSVLILALGVANQTKLWYRDDIVKFQDIYLLKEAFIMTQKYDIIIKKYTILVIIITVLITIILERYFKKSKIKLWKQLLLLIVAFIITITSYNLIYKNNKIYDSVGNSNLVNIWIGTRNYQIRGLIYPFVYTIEDGFQKKPDNYKKSEVIAELNKYNYENIPDDKKVNIIAIMLEAYNDFSKFNKIKFDEDIYKDFHWIQSKSLHGNLVTDIFAGGTIMTERHFLTGFNNLFEFRKKTNSYIWYFKEQGYRTEAMHPIYGAFYNRKSVNPNLGFDEYYHYDNKYSNIKYDFMNDEEFFKQIIEGYENSRNKNVPYFNFSVTYQNHGPYNSENYEGKEYYFKNKNMSEEGYNIINEYFNGIKKTNKALKELINYFESENEPTIILLFGDHNPYLGLNTLVYNELGINLDLSTTEGFKNYYQTPYIIYANSSAKKVFNNKFVGELDDISPMFLMNILFDNCGLKGNQYIQYTNDLRKNIGVINNYYLYEDKEYIIPKLSKYSDDLAMFNNVNYYYSHNYITNGIIK